MKRVFEHPPAPTSGKRYWRGPGELQDTPEFREWLEREFPAGAVQLEGDDLSRRSFLKLMGASMALAGLGLSSCRRPEYQILPFTKSLEWTIPGKALFYATAMPRRTGAIPLVATTVDGRPIKLEGNPLHPASGGATDAFAQASVLDLYDPVRSKRYVRREKIDGSDAKGKTSNRGEFEKYLGELLSRIGTNGGAGLAILAEEVQSPTRDRLRAELERRYPAMRWCTYEPLLGEQQTFGAQTAFGGNARLMPRFDRADVILALDSDFLDCGEGDIASSRAFASRRRVSAAKDTMNRLYVVENRYSLTGAMADHRLRLPASQIPAFTHALATRVGAATGSAELAGMLGTTKPAGGAPAWDEKWLDECAADLVRAAGTSLVVAGPMQPVAVQLLVYGINAALRNIGATLTVRDVPRNPRTIGILQLAAEITNGTIQQLVILGGDPVYNAPRGLAEDRETRRLLDWEELQRRVPEVVRLGYYEDATSAASHWHIPAAHYLESWGDALATDGSYVTIQPMILPLFGGISEIQLLNNLLGNPLVEGPELVQATFGTLGAPGDPAEAWSKMLRDGFAAQPPPPDRPATFNTGVAGQFIQQYWTSAPAPTAESPEIVFVRSYSTDDGRFINNGWLQEMPDPVTKLTWDNAALVSPAYAKHLGVKDGDMIEITVTEPGRAPGAQPTQRQLQVAVLMAPGHVDNSITIALGYGRKVGEYGPLSFSGVGEETPTTGDPSGFNAYLLRTVNSPHFIVADGKTVQNVRVAKIPGHYEFAITQEHFSIEGRGLVREATVERYRQDPQFVKKIGGDDHLPPKLPSIYSPPPMEAPHQWGMAIDLNTCTGCSACVVACQAENNVPIVGKLQVRLGRSMHWLRIDRYFADNREFNQDRGDLPQEPEMVHQPMLCQHCENAPCETVCPVNATVHSEDGLNVMAYNRCIGTRYCANNCPFKVRRFNYFDYNQRPVGKKMIAGNFGVHQEYLGPLTEKGMADTMKLQKNPNVTVRMRGVMEKCTFCVQRIQEAKIAAQVKAGPSPDVLIARDSFTTACAQACPTEAIVFGNIADPESRVSQIKKQDRNYRLLEYLNVRTRASYLARIRNPNPAMPDADQIGVASLTHAHDHAPGGDDHARQPGGHSYDQHNPGTLNPDPNAPHQPVGEHPEDRPKP